MKLCELDLLGFIDERQESTEVDQASFTFTQKFRFNKLRLHLIISQYNLEPSESQFWVALKVALHTRQVISQICVTFQREE